MSREREAAIVRLRNMEHRIVFHRTDEGYAVEVPGLPGRRCWTHGARSQQRLADAGLGQSRRRDWLPPASPPLSSPPPIRVNPLRPLRRGLGERQVEN